LFSFQDSNKEEFKPKELSLPFVQADVLNSANNLFKKECIDNWIQNFGRIPVYLVDGEKEELVGKAVCAYWYGKWAVAKIEVTKPVPDNYVLRPHSKPIKAEVNEGCYFHISKAELMRLLLVNPIYASKYPPSTTKDSLIFP
jgi:hypothetical protein